MRHRTTPDLEISNDEIGLLTKTRLFKLFQRHSKSPATASLPLYLACQNNDTVRVESCLRKMKLEEIDYQHGPNNETALHIATRNQHKEIIEILLFHGARRSLRNIFGQEAYELAQTEEIKELFKRPESCRFVSLHSSCKTTVPFRPTIKCKTCSIINDDTFYEWELIDPNAPSKALKFRDELKPSKLMTEKSLIRKLYSIKKGYINTRLTDPSTKDDAIIQEYFKNALRDPDPNYIITAFTKSQNFTTLLNTDMARNVMHDLKNGCSKFSCECLYSTEDGTKAISSILFRHPKFQQRNFKGIVYRGIVTPKNKLSHYKVGSCIITTTFLATSKNPVVAQFFGDKTGSTIATHSFFCTYEIVNDERTALDISKISEFEPEDEVLILPYSAFLITKIEEEQEITNIYLKEQCLTHICESTKLQENLNQSTTCLFETIT